MRSGAGNFRAPGGLAAWKRVRFSALSRRTRTSRQSDPLASPSRAGRAREEPDDIVGIQDGPAPESAAGDQRGERAHCAADLLQPHPDSGCRDRSRASTECTEQREPGLQLTALARREARAKQSSSTTTDGRGGSVRLVSPFRAAIAVSPFRYWMTTSVWEDQSRLYWRPSPP